METSIRQMKIIVCGESYCKEFHFPWEKTHFQKENENSSVSGGSYYKDIPQENTHVEKNKILIPLFSLPVLEGIIYE